MTIHVLPRWAALVSIMLLLPPTWAGSICLREDRPGSFELDCACTHLPAMGGTGAIALPNPDDCGPCRDVRIIALSGRLPNATGTSPAGVVEPSPAYPEIETLVLTAAPTWHVGVPRGRPPAVLRC